MALAGVLAGAAQRHAVVDGAVVPDLGGLPEHNTHAVVNEQLAADFGAGMDLDAGEMPRQLTDEPCAEKPFVPIQKMCDLVRDQHMKTGIQNDDLRHIARGGVLVPDVFCVFPKPHDFHLLHSIAH